MVTQRNIDAALSLLASARNTAGNVRNSFLLQMANLIGSVQVIGSGRGGLAQRLLEEGNTQGANLLDEVALTAFQATSGQESYNFSRWERLLRDARSQIRAVAELSPQQSAATAQPIRVRQDRLANQIRQMGGSIGGSLSVRGALIGTSTEPIQMEWMAIQTQIRNAILTPEDRESLLARQRELLGQTEDVVIQAGREGEDVSAAIDQIENLRQNLGGKFLDCMIHGSRDISCFLEGQGRWVTAGIVIVAVGALLWFSMPAIKLYMLTRSKKKRSRR